MSILIFSSCVNTNENVRLKTEAELEREIKEKWVNESFTILEVKQNLYKNKLRVIYLRKSDQATKSSISEIHEYDKTYRIYYEYEDGKKVTYIEIDGMKR